MESFEELKSRYAHIPGWGVDADPENEPTYPMKNYTGEDHERLNWQRPPVQQTDVEILRSNERPYITAVYGTTNPPTALSGRIRRLAFKQSESSMGHWLPLLIADRINVVEGFFDDFRRGYIPNIFKEKGWGAEWKYNPSRIVKRLFVAGLIATVLISVGKGKK